MAILTFDSHVAYLAWLWLLSQGLRPDNDCMEARA